MSPEVAIKSILDIKPYVPGTSSVGGGIVPIKLSSNENPFGPSPRAREAASRAAIKMHRYPDGSSKELIAAIADRFSINASQIVAGAGSDEIISLLCQAYAGVGDEVLYTEHGFLMYPISALRVGAKPVEVKETGLKADVGNILAGITSKTKIIFLANPNNPTGSYLNKSEIRHLLDNIPSSVLLVIDAAYTEYAEHNDFEDGMNLVNKYHNLVVTRTFSKVYGLGGLRLGWSYSSPDIADILNRVRGPFNVSSIAQEAGIAALKDKEFIEQSVAHNTSEKIRLADNLSELGIKIYPSAANFLLADFSTTGKSAKEADEFMRSTGIILRRMEAYKLPTCLRLTIGKTEENKAVFSELRKFLEK
jgi:histidinol-phosphate aminotransferase